MTNPKFIDLFKDVYKLIIEFRDVKCQKFTFQSPLISHQVSMEVSSITRRMKIENKKLFELTDFFFESYPDTKTISLDNGSFSLETGIIDFQDSVGIPVRITINFTGEIPTVIISFHEESTLYTEPSAHEKLHLSSKSKITREKKLTQFLESVYFTVQRQSNETPYKRIIIQGFESDLAKIIEHNFEEGIILPLAFFTHPSINQ